MNSCGDSLKTHRRGHLVVRDEGQERRDALQSVPVEWRYQEKYSISSPVKK